MFSLPQKNSYAELSWTHCDSNEHGVERHCWNLLSYCWKQKKAQFSKESVCFSVSGCVSVRFCCDRNSTFDVLAAGLLSCFASNLRVCKGFHKLAWTSMEMLVVALWCKWALPKTQPGAVQQRFFPLSLLQSMQASRIVRQTSSLPQFWFSVCFDKEKDNFHFRFTTTMSSNHVFQDECFAEKKMWLLGSVLFLYHTMGSTKKTDMDGGNMTLGMKCDRLLQPLLVLATDALTHFFLSFGWPATHACGGALSQRPWFCSSSFAL